MPAQALVRVTINNVDNPQVIWPRNQRDLPFNDGLVNELPMPGPGNPPMPVGIEFGLTNVDQVDGLIEDLRNVRNILGA